jgi:hypothetical protein
MNLVVWGGLTVLSAMAAVFFAGCVFVYVGRLENRTPAAFGEKVGAHKGVLAKLRKREPLTQDEFDYAHELVDDARSPLAYAIPAVLFTAGFFYVVGCLYELQVHGGNPSFRTFIGGLPMLGSLNIFGQMHRVARLKGRLHEVAMLAEPSDRI